jgi:molybdate transport system regulatory protein
MKISARNKLHGRVHTVVRGAVNADVILDLPAGLSIFANITNEAVEELGLKPGKAATALIKSSFILLSLDPNVRVSARNRLTGVVTDVIPGSVNAEVKLRLPGDTVLSAIVTEETVHELGLTAGQPCTALIKSSHVLIAVDD